MDQVFRIELLPARHGDCILIEYGDIQQPGQILIDGGPIGAYDVLNRRIQAMGPQKREFELFVITHIDADHIEGAIKLLNNPELASFHDIWFNGWPQLDQPLVEPLAPVLKDLDPRRSPIQGEYLAVRIAGRVWNGYFGGDPIFVPEHGSLPEVTLPGGMKLTLLSPHLKALKNLKKTWDASLERLGTSSQSEDIRLRLQKKVAYRNIEVQQRVDDILSSAQEAIGKVDGAVANGSSIAFIAEYAGKRCGFLGDAHTAPVERSLARFAKDQGVQRVHFDALKLAHHGSSANITPSLLSMIECNSYLVSTDGSIFNHPDDEAIHMIVTSSPGARLYFNYHSERTAVWGEPERQARLGFTAIFPQQADTGLIFDVFA